MSENLTCKIWTLKEILFEGDIQSLTYPNILFGPTTILKNHIPTVGLIKKGTITYSVDDDSSELKVDKGIIHVENNQVNVILL